ncbi:MULTISPECIES: PhoH family protein [unclassified Pseudodesulfovibrio]|uniref:PhoH family protein n=1 Tax=unclassified Pseudodesulfovibrio TaxID=2661612 RepID=UPI001F4F6A94|nr:MULTISPECIES: PhoH family protein [unclassified Pseudodesulfovibrio]MCJ2164259.1 PhoH family protein [Pseudodesulfovibrio sp. S3-i]
MASQLFGPHGQHLKLLGERIGARIESRGNSVVINLPEGEEDKADLAAQVLTQLYAMIRRGKAIYPQDVDFACRILERQPSADVGEVFKGDVYATSGKRTVSPKSLNQREYLDAIRESDMTFGIGPAGTGKTYLAVAMAVGALARREVKRIVLTRPAVEAGEKLGFLPGDLAEKINPYLRPLYDALHDMFDFAKVQDYQESGIIEVAPLAFMRGRTLNDAFIILDEAQNTTPEQMKMFLTRLGFGSKAVVTGDITQIDLPVHSNSGLLHARRILGNVAGVKFITFDEHDVIRHPLVGRIVRAYDIHERNGK